MLRATTPTHRFTFPFDFSKNVAKLLITYSQWGEVILNKTEKDVKIDGNTVYYKLSQEETSKFLSGGAVEIQARVLTINGTALASKVYSKPVNRVLNDEVL